MKRIVFICSLLLAAITMIAQVPAGFSYQAVVRNSSGEIIANKSVKFRFSIYRGSETGTKVYVETQSASTNTFGLTNLKIGMGTKVSGTFDPTAWGDNPHFLKVELDPAGGSTFTELGTTQLLAVPYAFHALTVGNADDADADPTNEIQDLEINGNELGLTKSSTTITLPSSTGGDGWGTQTVVADETLDGNGTTSSPLKIAQQSATSGQVLKWSGSTWTPGDVSGGTSFWQQNGTDIYYTAGHVGIGTNEPSSSNLLHVYGNGLFQGSFCGISIGPNGPAASINFNYEGGWSANIALDRGKTTFSGNVGIGIFDPEARLHVDDNIRIGRDFDYENVYGELIHEGSIHGFKINSNAGGDWADMYLQTDGKTRLFIESGGNVGIGTVTPATRLHVKQAGTSFTNGLRLERPDNTNWWSIQINHLNDLVFDYNGTNTRAWIENETAEYNHSSDRNLKTDINPIKSSLIKVLQLNPVTFRFKTNPDSKNVSYGLIAQEVEQIYPEFVSENNGYLGIAYHNFSVVNIRAIQEQQEQIILLQKQMEELMKQNKELQGEIIQLRTTMNSRLEKVETMSGTLTLK